MIDHVGVRANEQADIHAFHEALAQEDSVERVENRPVPR
jgi:hypothetical protein